MIHTRQYEFQGYLALLDFNSKGITRPFLTRLVESSSQSTSKPREQSPLFAAVLLLPLARRWDSGTRPPRWCTSAEGTDHRDRSRFSLFQSTSRVS